MSLKIDEYLSSCGVVSELMKQQAATEIVSTGEAVKKDGDSYISTIGSSETVLPCENYNDILQVMQKAKAETNQSETSAEEAEQTEAVSGAGGAGGSGGGSESEEETTTEIVVIDGVTYLETTTVVDGITTVQRTVISDQSGEENTDLAVEKEAE